MDISLPTPSEIENYPHLFFTSDMEWKLHSVDEYTVHDLDLTTMNYNTLIIILTLLMLMGS
jgi:hypothetical protein